MLVHRDALLSTVPACSDKDTRYYHNTIQAQPDDGSVVATDGSILIRATPHEQTDPNDWPPSISETVSAETAPFVIPAPAAKDAAKAAANGKQSLPILSLISVTNTETGSKPGVRLECSKDLQSVYRADTPVYEGTYPNHEQIVSSAKQHTVVVSVTLGAAMLKTLLAAMKAAGAQYVALDFSSASNPLVFNAKGTHVNLSGVAMPCKPSE